MLCVMARRYLAAGDESFAVDDARGKALARHLASCAGCRSEQSRLNSLASLLSNAAAPPRVDDDIFMDRLMTTIRSRQKSHHHPQAPFTWAAFRPAMALPALCLMLAAAATAFFLSDGAIPDPPTRLAANGSAAALTARADEYHDTLKPPREVPFSVDQDLVGTRRGTIPLTTYVLEPAPREEPIVLASF